MEMIMPNAIMAPFPMVQNPFDQELELEYSPITQIVSSVAHLLEMHQRSKEKHEEDHHIGDNEMSEIRSRPHFGQQSPFSLIPYTQEIKSSPSRIVNSIPTENVPSVVYRIGDLMSNGNLKKIQSENVYDLRKVSGFPIVKSSDPFVGVQKDAPIKKSGKEWKMYEIAKRFLGLDEIPTAEEGNAIAQLFNISSN
ncbi:unnamed protein product [Caenorhabditis bovis]|uniref:Uncharacterized protein n=1 Tax=Caenorhabditis bovis TaxID=2654633 RepID=A0A8S1ED98_9PELO|nr:unnamed protein product [Caenorhabditis bovis]